MSDAERGSGNGPRSQPNGPDFDALVSALKDQAAALDRLASSIGQMATAILMMVDEGDDEPEERATMYLDGKYR